tara:strand:+ start:1139 stop:1828 length:690 start_codon:yes stop_codon:yes gene_type:complete
MLKHINQISEDAFLLDFGSNIDIQTNNFVINYSNFILNDLINIKKLGIINCVPSYNKILLEFDPLLENKKKIINFIEKIKINEIDNKNVKNIEIPICYDDEYGLDLDEIAFKTHLTKKKIIEIHLNTIFHIYMIGFMPGLPFMGNMNRNLILPRKITPRINICRGSVGIVNNLCVIYPNNSPGGWNIIGRTPINLFFKSKNDPLLLKPGNKVKFKQIKKTDFKNLYDCQ